MGRTERREDSRENLKGNLQPEVTHSIPTPEVTHSSQDVTRVQEAAKKAGFFSEKLKSLSSHGLHRKHELPAWIDHSKRPVHEAKDNELFAYDGLEFSRKLMELAKISKPCTTRKRRLHDPQDSYYDDPCIYRRKTARKEGNDFSRRLVGLTAQKKRFDPYEHAHCCRCVQSFECFWPRPNLLTIRMQDINKLHAGNH